MDDELAKRQGLDEWAVVERLLPPGWQEEAYLSGALRRRRGIRDASSLLRCLLLHLAEGCSLAETASRVRESGLGEVSSVALFKRLRASGPWLVWLARSFWQQRRGKPSVDSSALRMIATDATLVVERGTTGSQWRVHWALDVETLDCVEFKLTGLEAGETFRQFRVHPQCVMTGDRAYGRARGIHHVVNGGGDVLARFAPTGTPFQDAGGQKISWPARLRGLHCGDMADIPVMVPFEGQKVAGRVVAVRRSRAAAERARKRVAHVARRNQHQASPLSLKLASYVMIFTTLPKSHYSARQVAEYYRLRWQVELVFKRMKSIMSLGQLPKHDPPSARAWIAGKLLVAMLVERLRLEAESFSPWGYPLETQAQPLA
jgi:hypothetical protein